MTAECSITVSTKVLKAALVKMLLKLELKLAKRSRKRKQTGSYRWIQSQAGLIQKPHTLCFERFLYKPCLITLNSQLKLRPKRKLEAESATVVVMDVDGSAVEYHGVLYDGEAQSGATHLARTTLVHTIEALEETL